MLQYLRSHHTINIKLILLKTNLWIKVVQSYGMEFYFNVSNDKTVSQILNYYNYLKFSSNEKLMIDVSQNKTSFNFKINC